KLGGSKLANKKLVLIDGNSIIYRAFFALPLLNNDKGVYTNAVYGFSTMLFRILEEEQPSHMLVAFDAGKTTFRHKTYKDYKGGRQKTPPELSEQFPLVRELLDAFHISHYELDQYEADDIIGTLAQKGKEKEWDVTVISGDKDLLQLVSDKVTVNLTRKGISEVDAYTPQILEEKVGISPNQVIDMKALMGDKSDNIPGVPGIGEKTAVKLLKEYKTLDNVYEHLDEVSGKKLKENLITYKDDAYLSKELATIDLSTPAKIKLDDVAYTGFESSKVHNLFKDLEFNSLLNKLNGEDAENEEVSAELQKIEYQILDKVTGSIFTGNEAIFVEMLTDNYHQAPVEGIGIVNSEQAYFVPTDVAV